MPLCVSRRALIAASLVVAPDLLFGRAWAKETGFAGFLAAIRREALAQGIRARTVDSVLREARYLSHVIELDRRQPERRLTFAEYLDRVVTRERETASRRHLVDNRRLLDRIRYRFDVDPRFIVALWAIESNFGGTIGNFPVVSALATLGYDGRRGSYFRKELIAALRILDAGDVGAPGMIGSWAGAMGQCQFMPSTYLAYAVDFDGDGRRDIWFDRADALASIANFIARLGWRGGESWGQKVRLPHGFDSRLAGLGVRRSVAAWRRAGIRAIGPHSLPTGARLASIVLPDGIGGPAFLVYDNFRALMRWNHSTYFGIAVGYLADGMARA